MDCPTCGAKIYAVAGGRIFCPQCGYSAQAEGAATPQPAVRPNLDAALPTVRPLSAAALEACVILARKLATSTKPQRPVVITSERDVWLLEWPQEARLTPTVLAELRELVPPGRPWYVAAIGSTAPQALRPGSRLALPMLDWLHGLAQLGHTVVLFEGHASLLERVLRGADLLLVEKALEEALPFQWSATADRVMAEPRILMFDPSGDVERLRF
jgi:hypothetical protein